MRDALIRSLSHRRAENCDMPTIINSSWEQMADFILPDLVDPLASRLHQYEHADHLDSTGCWLGHRMKARFLLGMLDAPTEPEAERG